MKKPLILISNDDGIHAKGILELDKYLKSDNDVYVVAPSTEKSASSHAITLHRPLRIREIKKRFYAVDGTPADCVLLAKRLILPRNPDLIISGVNSGPNIGDDVHYSGTVSIAREAAILGIPAIAISAIPKGSHDPWIQRSVDYPFTTAAIFAQKLVKLVLKHKLPKGTFLNVNVPYGAKDYEITILGKRDYGNAVAEKTDPRGHKYYWLGADEPTMIKKKGSDGNAIARSNISVTPLHIDVTYKPLINELKNWSIK